MDYYRLKKSLLSRVIAFLMALLMTFSISSCAYFKWEKTQIAEYYSSRDNYVTASGTVKYFGYLGDKLVIGLSDMDYNFSDIRFVLMGKNLSIAQECGLDEKIKEGSVITFAAPPKIFYDGYRMPIVALSIDGEELLSFEEGFSNVADYLN